MGEYNNRYYGGMNKESQIRSNSFHTHTNAHHISVDTKKLEEQETLSSASSTAAQTASTAATTTTTAAASSSAAVGSSAAVAGGTAAAVATATAVVVASAIFVPTIKDFKYESSANTISYSFNLSYKNADTAIVTLENRQEKYEETFELESYFAEEKAESNDESFIAFEEGRFIDLTPSTTYRLSISVLDGDNSYNVFSERVKTNDTPTSDFVVTADFAINEETQCLDGMISIDDPGHYYESGSIYAEIVSGRSEYPETTDATGNPFEEEFEEVTEQVRRVYEISDLSAIQSFYVGGLEGGDDGLSLTIYATSGYEGKKSSKPYFQKNYAFSSPVTYVTFNFYNDDGTVLWDSQTIPYGVEVSYKGETNLDDEANRRSRDMKVYFLGWASVVGGEPYDGPMYAFEDRDYYAVFGEKIYTVTVHDRNYTILSVEVPYGETFCINDSQAGGYDFWREPDANGCYSFDHYEDINGNIISEDEEITITGDLDIYAVYTVTGESVHTIFYDYDGTVLQDNYQMASAGTVYYDYSLPTREGSAANDKKYRFIGWTCAEMDNQLITNNEMYELDASDYGGETLTFTATYAEGEYIVTFYNEDGSAVLATQYAYSGDEVHYPYDDPTKEPTTTKQYNFIGWDEEPNGTHGLREFSSITEDRFYYACFVEEDREYTISFYDGNQVVYTYEATYGETLTIDDCDVNTEDFMKEPDADGCYSFNNFVDENGDTVFGYDEFTVTSDINFYATYVVTMESVHTLFYNYDGTLLQDNYQEAYYGVYYDSEETPEGPEPEEEGGIVEFVGWHCTEMDMDFSPEDLNELDISSYGGQTLTFTARFFESH